MIDFIKVEVVKTQGQILEQNLALDFYTPVSTTTGEVFTIYKKACHKGLVFKIYEPTIANPQGRITLEGSLHKYWNNGAHNFNDFGLTQINEVLINLQKTFGIESINCNLRALEIGVNITPPQPTERILQYSLLHKKDLIKSIFTKDEGNYKQARHQRHTFKIYDKRRHYQNHGFIINREILRIEKKWERMHELNQMGIFSLSDLMSYGLENFNSALVGEWQNTLFYDWQTLDQTKYRANYSNPNYWLELKAENFKYHRKRLNELIEANPENIRGKIANLIGQKVIELNRIPTQINSLNILLKGVVSGLGMEQKKCLVTGLNIEMQKADSFLLSHTGLRYYQKTNGNIFGQLKRRYISATWQNATVDVQIRELAHNIRNQRSNTINSQRNRYPVSQTNNLAQFGLNTIGTV